ncbi:cytochrome P450 [Laetiporus sulphureus 93-53]|uniref:Cytochrome P450 n=1 Tax=Laetiporus sulphureus 93-53 TaxID=1314785 RepID=A0A165G0H8_9APHY|nr:cytochrome P450 [Laetiporus sulphureus 93-53]KZT09665.1 cytochrome P450 [Laetiporus sulphureus 93-53]
MPPYGDVLFILGIALTTVTVYYFNRSIVKLPPGPRGISFFGNLFQVHALRPHPQASHTILDCLSFLEWAQQYGEIFHLKMGFGHMIVLNTAEAADELLANRSKIYSSRATPHVAQDIVSDGQRMVFMSYTREWKVLRRTLQSILGPGPSKRLRKMQELESRVVIYDLLSHADQSVREIHLQGPNGEVPERHWFALVRRYTTSVVLHMAYGHRVHRLSNNPELHKIYDVLGNITCVAQPGNYLADAFSSLRKLPDFLAPWRVDARKMHLWEMELWGKLFADCRAALENGIPRAGFVASYLQSRAEAGLQHLAGNGVTPGGSGWIRDKLLAYTAGSVLEAGSDTTATTIQIFVMLMLHNPKALKQARQEIDEVVGMDRMPTYEDEEKLPWLVACIKETLRRRPPTIMGVPHRVDEDDIYNGYFIPKGSTVVGNVWAIHMNPERFPNPKAFMPERFYEPGKPSRWGSGPDSQDRDHYAFGWGRRFCQGSHISEASLFIVLSRLIWGVEFSAPIDPQTGKPKLPDIDDEVKTWSEGFISVPRIYPVAFKARSDKHASIIHRAFDDVQIEWQGMGLAGDER